MMRYLWMLCLVLPALGSFAQSAAIQRKYLLTTDTLLLDTLVLVNHSVSVEGYSEPNDFAIDYRKGMLLNRRIPLQTEITVNYLALRYPLKQEFRHRDPAKILPHFQETRDPFKLEAVSSGYDFSGRNEGLLTTGSIMRGITLGNNQNAVVNSHLNLQFSGKLNREVEVLAAVSDDNNPVQPEGNTRDVQDFDQVYVQFKKDKHTLIVGDYLMSRPDPGYFMNYYKKSRGLSVNTGIVTGKGMLKVNAQAALARGRFVRNLISGQEGNQGPYRLSGPNGELYIIVISGTETVFLDGEKLVRGEQNDYTIDYNSGEVTFMPRRMITQYSRIVVEFQYADRNYARTLFTTGVAHSTKNFEHYLNYYTEQDNPNQPFQQLLTDSAKRVLAAAGDDPNKALVSGATPYTVYDSKKILYRKTDTLGYAGIFVFADAPGTDTVFYEVRFSYVGNGKGNYRQGQAGANGRVFQWVAPVAGMPQGDFEPVIKLVAPRRRQMLTAGTIMNLSKNHQLKVEGALSIDNRNLYSTIDKSDDAGCALKLESSNTLPIGTKTNAIRSQVSFEFTDARFRSIERYRSVEFNRIWNRQLTNTSEQDQGSLERILSWRLAYVQKEQERFFYQLGGYNQNNNALSGWRHQAGWNLVSAKNRFTGVGEYLQTQSALVANPSNNTTHKVGLIEERRWKPMRLGLSYDREQSDYKRNTDSLLSGSFGYDRMSSWLRSNDTTRLGWWLEGSRRTDRQPLMGSFRDYSRADEVKSGVTLLQQNFNKLQADAAFRNFTVLDTAFRNLKPEQTFLTRIEYDYGFLNRSITANTYLQMGSGNELRRDYQYVQVPPGLGVYVWQDFNEDGIQQLNEFQPASYVNKNQADYIKVFLPTTSLIRVNTAQFSQTLNLGGRSSRKRSGFAGFINRFSNQSAMRLERKVQGSNNGNLLRVFSKVADTSLITMNSQLRNTLFYNRNNPRFGADIGWSRQDNRNLLTNGLEERFREEYSLGLRWNLNASWSLNSTLLNGSRSYRSQFFSANDYRFVYTDFKPRLSWQYLQLIRLTLEVQGVEARNAGELGGDKSFVRQAGAEFRYSQSKVGVVTIKYNFYQVDYSGNLNTPVAYEMLQGLSKGENQLFNATLQQRIGQNLQLDFTYEARKAGLVPLIQTGRMEVRYLF